MKLKDVDEFDAVNAQLGALHEEILVLVKKSPNDVLSVFKLGVVNGLLRRANALLGDAERPMADFTDFAADALPSSSDTALVVGQYLAALENFRARRITDVGFGEWFWNIADGKGKRKTFPPRKLRL